MMRNLYEYSRYLRQFYPQNQVAQIGLDRLYAYENSKGRVINNIELLGLLAYNRAYLAKEKRDYARAYEYVLLAQSFNADSRSNVRFEISLYQHWGKDLFARGNYPLAFQVMADAAYRYADQDEFVHNTKAAYFYSIGRFWQIKDWGKTKRMTEELLDLNIIDGQEAGRIEIHLQQWQAWLMRNNNIREGRNAKELIEEVYSVRIR